MEILTSLALGLAVALVPWGVWRLAPSPAFRLWLEQAGYPGAERWLGHCLLLMAALTLMLALLPWPLPLMAVLMACLPPLWIEARRRARLEMSEGEVGHIAGAVALGVSAGRDLESSLAFAVTKGRGPLSSGLAEALSRLRLGQSRSEAFSGVSRVFPCAGEFLRSLELGESQGVSLGETLERQADLWRRRRLDKAEARALRVPVLLLAPLALCIFPNVLMALLGPFLLDLAWITP
ncbi:MAG: type II secretion system F family protein [Planctomycetota bacterium]